MKRDMKGQSLLEVLVAISFAVVLITVVTVVVTSSLGSSNYGKIQTQAAHYAQDGIERMRELRDTNSGAFFSMSGTRCLNASGDITAGCALTNGVFMRRVLFESDAALCGSGIKLTSVVSWDDNKCSGSSFCHEVRLTSCFTDYNSPPAI